MPDAHKSMLELVKACLFARQQIGMPMLHRQSHQSPQSKIITFHHFFLKECAQYFASKALMRLPDNIAKT